MNVLDLFSGIGGFSLGLERAGMTTVAFCEIEEYPRKVLAKHWPHVPIYKDVRELNATRLAADGITGIELICGGFPCQPFSVAGKQLGAEDDRHLWPEYFRLIQELRPTWVIGENVIGLVSLGLDSVLDDLESIGYSTRTFDIPACGVGAPHERRRLWIVAYSNGFRRSTRGDHWEKRSIQNNGEWNDSEIQSEGEQRLDWISSISQDVADSTEQRQQGSRESIQRCGTAANGEGQADHAESMRISDQWSIEPNVGRVANGVPARAHRLKAIGNAVVPQIPEIIGRAIMEIENERHA